jgi:hypothetical protein
VRAANGRRDTSGHTGGRNRSEHRYACKANPLPASNHTANVADP